MHDNVIVIVIVTMLCGMQAAQHLSISHCTSSAGAWLTYVRITLFTAMLHAAEHGVELTPANALDPRAASLRTSAVNRITSPIITTRVTQVYNTQTSATFAPTQRGKCLARVHNVMPLCNGKLTTMTIFQSDCCCGGHRRRVLATLGNASNSSSGIAIRLHNDVYNKHQIMMSINLAK